VVSQGTNSAGGTTKKTAPAKVKLFLQLNWGEKKKSGAEKIPPPHKGSKPGGVVRKKGRGFSTRESFDINERKKKEKGI